MSNSQEEEIERLSEAVRRYQKKLEDAQQRIKDYEDSYRAIMEERCDDDRVHCTCVPDLRAAVKEAREEVLDLFVAHCPAIAVGPDVRYDTMSSRTYEYTQELLIQWGLLKPEQCLSRPAPLAAKPSELGPGYMKVELPFPLKRISIDLLKDAEVKIPVDPAPVTPKWADEEK